MSVLLELKSFYEQVKKPCDDTDFLLTQLAELDAVLPFLKVGAFENELTVSSAHLQYAQMLRKYPKHVIHKAFQHLKNTMQWDCGQLRIAQMIKVLDEHNIFEKHLDHINQIIEIGVCFDTKEDIKNYINQHVNDSLIEERIHLENYLDRMTTPYFDAMRYKNDRDLYLWKKSSNKSHLRGQT